jgi:hypothetical protein
LPPLGIADTLFRRRREIVPRLLKKTKGLAGAGGVSRARLEQKSIIHEEGGVGFMTKKNVLVTIFGVAVAMLMGCGSSTDGAIATALAPATPSGGANQHEFIFYNSSDAKTQGCEIFIDNQTISTSFEDGSGAHLAFSVVDFKN